MSAKNISRYSNVRVPEWCKNTIQEPSLTLIASEEAGLNAIDEIYRDTLKKHRIEEQYPKLTHPGPYNLIRRMCEKVVEKLRSGDELQDMDMALNMVHDMPEYSQFYKNDHTIKLAVESVVINALWRYVEVEGSIKSPFALLEKVCESLRPLRHPCPCIDY
jgi:hypothetical protein